MNNPVVLVTGALTGIGRAAARGNLNDPTQSPKRADAVGMTAFQVVTAWLRSP
jgi:hypothetical protein